MKKLIALAMVAIAANSFAYTVRVCDINRSTNQTEIVLEDYAKTNTIHVNFKKLMVIVGKMTNQLDKARVIDGYDIGASKHIKYCQNHGIFKNANSFDLFPKTFDALIAYLNTKNAKYAELVRKYRRLNVYSVCTLQELIDAYETEKAMATWKRAVSERMIPYIKANFRKNGKTFVAKKLDGKLVNPMDEPLKELSNIINGPRVVGLNEFFKKYDVPATIDTSFLPSDAEIEELKYNILIDKKSINNNKVILEKVLGVKGFNDFVKLYNYGETK